MSTPASSSGMSSLKAQDVLPALRQMMKNLEPNIRASGSMDAAEDLMLHLEERDPSFHRYEFVKLIRSNIEESLGPLMDEEIEKYARSGQAYDTGQDTVVQTMVAHLVNSPAYSNLTQQLMVETKSAVDTLTREFQEEQEAQQALESRVEGPGFRRAPSFGYLSQSSDNDSCGSSLNNSDFMFPNQKEFEQIGEKMDQRQPVETRIEAIEQLGRIPPTEVLSSDNWSQLKKGLMDALGDANEQLADKSLQLHARMFSSSQHSMNREVYTSLVEHLNMQFTYKGQKGDLKTGLDVTSPSACRLLRRFRLMNEFMCVVPSYWIRCPDKFLEEVIDSTLYLLHTHPTKALGGAEPLTPVHYLAMLDKKAGWFKKWMHGNYSRTVVLRMLKEKYRALIDNAVKKSLEFCESRKQPHSLLDEVTSALQRESISTDSQLQNIGEGKRTTYAGPELEYIYFIHSLCMLGRMLLYSKGRAFFPIKVKDKEVKVTDLLVSFVQLLSLPNQSTRPYTGLDAASLVADVLKMIAGCEAALVECLCKDAVVSVLLEPVKARLKPTKGKKAAGEATLLHIADILSCLASSQTGRRMLLYGEAGNKAGKPNRNISSTAAHTIVEFATRALSSTLPSEESSPSYEVVGAYVFVCRQLYSTCEGLSVMHSYKLHACIAEAWRMASHEADIATTPLPAVEGDQTDSRRVLLWEESLIDNLLNFAATPKGLLLLQQTGHINECVDYMYARYAKKLQVSKHEKFGYGVMVTQVAATAPGMVALQSTGFIKALVNELWTQLECGRDDVRVIRPTPIPVDPIDRTAHKSFTAVLNLLSSFPAVYEALAEQKLQNAVSYTFRDMPNDMVGLIERLILVDTPAKMHALFNYEQSHTFGLRVLSVMCSCLDTFLLLETQYKVQESLLGCQAENVKEESNELIIDALSVERNHVLVRTYLIGGPSERKLPPRVLLEDGRDPYPFPLFSSFPIPKSYPTTMAGRSAMKQDSELSRYLSQTKTAEKNQAWLDGCRKAFCKVLTSKPDLAKANVLVDMLEKVVQGQIKVQEETIFPKVDYKVMARDRRDVHGSDKGLKSQSLSAVQQLGVQLTIRYGTHLNLVKNSKDTKEQLSHLLKQVRFFLRQQQRNIDCQLRLLQGEYVGHDWFTSTLFLMMMGKSERCWNFLLKFSTLLSSGYLWMPRLHASAHLPVPLTVSGIHPVYYCSAHYVELILQAEVPAVASAFRMSGYTPSQICQHWLRQCFWNYLDWLEICHYLCTCIVLGVDYQVYTCVAILRHLTHDILQHTQNQDLQVFLKEQPIPGFRVGEHLEFMQQLEERYRQTVQPDMRNLAKP
ncbi:TBC1D32 [Branchiostoma lanceolatum]|uniref:Protein broad-minded n=1 Tax=Branchiostoma lanceolatum TaxID=7740 RepID=A0A8K0EV33_BRALA|nr:TBC1D32 [Branchiostoma lanceolatum]